MRREPQTLIRNGVEWQISCVDCGRVVPSARWKASGEKRPLCRWCHEVVNATAVPFADSPASNRTRYGPRTEWTEETLDQVAFQQQYDDVTHWAGSDWYYDDWNEDPSSR